MSAIRFGRSIDWARAAGQASSRKRSETRIVDRQDRVGAVLGRALDREAAVRLERRPDPLGPLGDLVRRDHGAEDGLGHDVVGEMGRAVDDAHSGRSSSRRSGPPARSAKA